MKGCQQPPCVLGRSQQVSRLDQSSQLRCWNQSHIAQPFPPDDDDLLLVHHLVQHVRKIRAQRGIGSLCRHLNTIVWISNTPFCADLVPLPRTTAIPDRAREPGRRGPDSGAFRGSTVARAALRASCQPCPVFTKYLPCKSPTSIGTPATYGTSQHTASTRKKPMRQS